MSRSSSGDARSTAEETTNRGGSPGSDQESGETEAAGLLANAALRIGLLLVGFVLFLFALGQAVGFDLLDLFIEAISSQTGRWLIVAFFGLVLIALAQRGVQGTLFES